MNRPSMTQMHTCLCLPKEAEIRKDTTTGQQNSKPRRSSDRFLKILYGEKEERKSESRPAPSQPIVFV